MLTPLSLVTDTAAAAGTLAAPFENLTWPVLRQLLVNGLALGSLYALTAFGIVLIYKTTDVVTFAQGEMAMFSTFIAFSLLNRRVPFFLAFVLTLLFAGLLGALVERFVLRPVGTASLLNPVIVTIGLGLILYGMAGRIWGYEIKTFDSPISGDPLRVLGAVVTPLNALSLAVTLVLMVVIFLFFRYTLLGVAMRAVAQNRLAARLMGVNVGGINMLGWALGTALGAVTGVFIAAQRTALDPNLMGDVAIKAFAGAVLGGLTSLPGAVLGGLVLGIIDSFAGFEAPNLRTSIAFALIVIVLAIRPGGLLGKHVIKKV